jgi:KUP system potassium uptake protein
VLSLSPRIYESSVKVSHSLKYYYELELISCLLHLYTGIAVVFVMTLTSTFLVLIMIMIWKSHMLLVIPYIIIIGGIELLYLSSTLYKFTQGGYLPLAFAAFLMSVMYIWNYVFRRKYYYELEHKISPHKLKQITADTSFCRIPGLAMFYSELVHGIPPIFQHYVQNVPALHSVLVFVTIKSLPISKVPVEERFLFRRLDRKELIVFRCVVRYGYTDVRNDQHEPFEKILIERLKEYVNEEHWLTQRLLNNSENDGKIEDENENENVKQVQDEVVGQEAIEREIEAVNKASHARVVHLIGETEVVAGTGSSLGKRIVIDYAYNFMKRNLRQSTNLFDIPHKCMLKVCMIYEL